MSETSPRRLERDPDDVPPRIPPGHPVRELSPSCKLVYLALQEDGPLTQHAIATWTSLPQRTVRYGIDQLQDAGVVDHWTSLRDNRRLVYDLADAPGGDLA